MSTILVYWQGEMSFHNNRAISGRYQITWKLYS